MKIFHTNFQNAERDFLFAENLRQVVRLILANAFRGPYPELTTVLQDIAATCPRLIDEIFIHIWDKEQRLFIMATRIDISDSFDQLLEYRILRRIPRQPEDAPFIISLHYRPSYGPPSQAVHRANRRRFGCGQVCKC